VLGLQNLALLLLILGLFQAPMILHCLFGGQMLELFFSYYIYVDDMIITGDDTVGICNLQNFLCQQFEMKDLGSLNYFLSLEVSFDSTGYYLSQAKYASDLLSRVGITDCKTVDSPLEMNVKLRATNGELLPDATLYR
jgi:hypothetical protein